MKYFVSYYFTSKDGWGNGNVDVDVASSINEIAVIRDIEKKLKIKNNFEMVVVLNWKRFEDDSN